MEACMAYAAMVRVAFGGGVPGFGILHHTITVSLSVALVTHV
jgi:hypothetical protein